MLSNYDCNIFIIFIKWACKSIEAASSFIPDGGWGGIGGANVI